MYMFWMVNGQYPIKSGIPKCHPVLYLCVGCKFLEQNTSTSKEIQIHDLFNDRKQFRN